MFTKLRAICYTSHRVRVATIEIPFAKNCRTWDLGPKNCLRSDLLAFNFPGGMPPGPPRYHMQYTWATPPWNSLPWPCLAIRPQTLPWYICRPGQGIVAQFHPQRLELQSGIHFIQSFSFAWWNSCCVCCWSSISFNKCIKFPLHYGPSTGKKNPPPFQYQRTGLKWDFEETH